MEVRRLSQGHRPAPSHWESLEARGDALRNRGEVRRQKDPSSGAGASQ